MDCVEKIIKKDWIHPLTGDKLTEKDIIPLQRVHFHLSIPFCYLKECQICFIHNLNLFFLLFWFREQQGFPKQTRDWKQSKHDLFFRLKAR